MSNLAVEYEQDLYAWAMRNVQLLREGRLTEIDAEHIAEELESMGRSEKYQLMNRLAILFAHLLKWQYQPEHRSGSWKGTIREQRKRLRKLFKENPSLKSEQIIAEVIFDAYDIGITRASVETGFAETIFPPDCPYTLDQALDENFYPEN